MKQMRAFRALTIAVFLVLATASQSAMGATITDCFGGVSISPIWAASGPGSETLTNSVAVSPCVQSVEFAASSTFPYFADLTHDFGSSQYGSVSVYAQSGVLCCGSAADIEVGDAPGTGDIADFQRLSDGNFEARVNPGPNEIDSSEFSGSGGWDQLEIVAGVAGLTFKLDGTTVYTNSSDTSGFRYIDLQVFGGPGGSEFFDNFVATTSGVTPEPSTWFMLGAGLTGILFRHLKRNN